MENKDCYVTKIGNFRKLYSGDIDFLDMQAEYLCRENSITKLDEKYDDWYECLVEELKDKYFIYKNSIYEILQTKDITDQAFCNMTQTDESNYKFVCSYYKDDYTIDEMLIVALMRSDK